MNEEKDSHSMGLRLDHETHEQVKKLIEIMGTTKKSQIIKIAIHRMYADLVDNIAEQIIIFDKSSFRKMFELLNAPEISTLGEHSAQNHIIKVRQKMLQGRKIENPKEYLEFFLNKFTAFVLKKHWKWLDDASWRFLDEHEIVIFITHDINHNFSLFMKSVMKHLLQQLFHYDLLDTKTILADNHLELHFNSKSESH